MIKGGSNWENHQAALALYFAYYSFCRVQMTLKQVPAMKAGLTDHPWSLQEFLKASGLESVVCDLKESSRGGA